LDRYFRGLKDMYEEKYKDNYKCEVQMTGALYQLISNLCGEYGLLCRMPEIIAAYKTKERKKYSQISLL